MTMETVVTSTRTATRTFPVFFRLKGLSMPEDSRIAELELEGFGVTRLTRVASKRDFENWGAGVAEDEGWQLPEALLGSGFAGYVTSEQLEGVVERSAFFREVFVFADSTQVSGLLGRFPARFADKCIDMVRAGSGGLEVIRFIPLSVIYEISEALGSSLRLDDIERNVEDALRYALDSSEIGRVSNAKLRAALRRLRFNNYASHSFHVYKARFFPRLVRAVLNFCMGTKNGRMLDPFVGSGTSLVEGYLMGQTGTGIDIDPLSCLITEVKVQSLGYERDMVIHLVKIFRFLEQRLVGEENRIRDTTITSFTTPTESVQTSHSYPLVFPSYLRKRLEEEVVRDTEKEVTGLLAAVDEASREMPEATIFFRLIVSDALTKKFKLRFHGLGFGRFAIESPKQSLTKIFLTQAGESLRLLWAFRILVDRLDLSPVFSKEVPRIIRGDTLKTNLSEQFDCIITSPPYLPAASGRESYLRSKGPSLLALGLVENEEEIWQLESDFIGALSRYPERAQLTDEELLESKLPESAISLVRFLLNDEYRAVKAVPTFHYLLSLKLALGRFRDWLRIGGKVAIVISTHCTFYRYSTREQVRKENVAETLEMLATSIPGLVLTRRIDLPLSKTLRVARPRARDAYSESILIFERTS